jgi:hypothetical protein
MLEYWSHYIDSVLPACSSTIPVMELHSPVHSVRMKVGTVFPVAPDDTKCLFILQLVDIQQFKPDTVDSPQWTRPPNPIRRLHAEDDAAFRSAGRLYT